MLPRIAITIGDPAGIGPEIVVKALLQPAVREVCRPVAVGSRLMLEDAALFCGRTLSVTAFDRDRQEDGSVEVADLENVDPSGIKRGIVSAAAGHAAYGAIERAARMALAGEVDAISTAPINKEAISSAGYGNVGHTELLAHLCGVPSDSVAMMLASSRLRVVHVTTHVPMVRAIELLTVDRISTTARLAAVATRQIIRREPRVAIAGLNSHAGEHGLFGHEEQKVIEPAIDRLRSEGLDVVGPVSPDTVFLFAVQGRYDVVVAMYHDQGHIPSKLLGFDDTVNVTLGLPIIRTSVDHGTAFDIAGKCQANEANLVAAISLASSMAGAVHAQASS